MDFNSRFTQHDSSRPDTRIADPVAATWNSGFKKGLIRFSSNNYPLSRSAVIYNDDDLQLSDGFEAVHYTRSAQWLCR